MVTSLNSAVPARDSSEQQVQYISGRHVLTGADTPAATKIGTFPAGSVILGISSKVVTAVAGGTPVLGVGTSAATCGTNGNIQNVMAEAAGSETVVPLAALVMPLAAATDLWVGTTGGATSGDVIIVGQYIAAVG